LFFVDIKIIIFIMVRFDFQKASLDIDYEKENYAYNFDKNE
jgi:hypothetical protein